VSFVEAIKYNLSHYSDFSGRGRRSEFWWFYLFTQLVSTVLIGIPYIFVFVAFFAQPGLYDPYNSSGPEFTPGIGVALAFLAVGALANLALLVPFLAAQARRLHDTGQSAHWLWLHLLSLGIVPLIMCIMDGQAFGNQYGPDPKGRDAWTGGGYAQPGYVQPGYAQAGYAQPSYGQPADAGYSAAPTPPAPPAFGAPPAPPAPPVPPAPPAYGTPPAPPAPPAFGAPPAPPVPPGNPSDPFASPQQ